jgi:hypothetical protein
MVAYDHHNITQDMRRLAQCFTDGDFTGVIDKLEVLLDHFRSQLPYEFSIKAAVGCHRHLGQLHNYRHKMKLKETERGFGVHPEKIIRLLGECGKILGENKDGDLLLVCSALQAESYMLRRESEAALEHLTNDEDGYIGFLRATCLYELGRVQEAVAVQAACCFLSTIFNYAPADWETLRRAHHSGQIEPRSQKIKSKRWLLSANAPLDRVLGDQIHGWSGGPRGIMSRRDRTVTIGSCFALNLAYALQREGMDAGSFAFAEDVNNTYANRTFFEKVLAFNESGRDEEFIGLSISDCCRQISEAKVLIFTSGTSVGFFDAEKRPIIPKSQSSTVNALFLKQSRARKITVSENVENLRFIVTAARIINPAIKVVLTVSPVPLGRSFEVDSALIGDCISKSTLRIAVDEVLDDEIPNVFYWPSFEIAKWVLPHYGGTLPGDMFFGAEDEASNHPAKAMVEMIVAAFLTYAVSEGLDA